MRDAGCLSSALLTPSQVPRLTSWSGNLTSTHSTANQLFLTHHHNVNNHILPMHKQFAAGLSRGTRMFPNQWRPGFGPPPPRGGMGMGMGMGPPMGRPMMGSGMRPRGPMMGSRAPFGRGVIRGAGPPRPPMGARPNRPVEYFEKPGGPSLGVFVGEVRAECTDDQAADADADMGDVMI